jgi:hypothetical protein
MANPNRLNPGGRLSSRRFPVVGLSIATAAAILGLACRASAEEGARFHATLTPSSTPSALPTVTPTIEIPATPTLNASPTLEATVIPNRMTEWLNFWPDTREKIAQMCGGNASQWQRNPEWPDSRTINNPALGIFGYVNREWRPANSENLPFYWPTTPQEAVDYFFPKQDPKHLIDPKFMQPAWIDPSTGQITGWHLSEDHWLVDGSPADVTLILHPCEVAEGYTVNGTLDPVDDRNWVAYGGANNNGNGGKAIDLAKGQGMTMWMPGTDPNAVGLRMELFVGADTPHYRGQNGEQLGPDAIGFDPVYPIPNK